MRLRKKKELLHSKKIKFAVLMMLIVFIGVATGFYIFKNKQTDSNMTSSPLAITHESVGSFRHLDAVVEKTYINDEKSHKMIDTLAQLPSPFAQLSPTDGVNGDKGAAVGKNGLPRTPGMPPVSQIPNAPRPLNGRGGGNDTKQGESVSINAIFTGAVNVAILSDGTIVKEGTETRFGRIGRIEVNGLYINGKFMTMDRSIPTNDNAQPKKEQNTANNDVSMDEANNETEQTSANNKKSRSADSAASGGGGYNLDNIVVPNISFEDKKLFGGQK